MRQLTRTFGIEIGPNDLEDHRFLKQLLLDQKLILVRGLFLSKESLLHIGSLFGRLFSGDTELRGNGEQPYKDKEHPELIYVSRDGMHGDRSISWHIDLIHMPGYPLPGRILYGHKIDFRTTTIWSDTEDALNHLTVAEKILLGDLKAHFKAPYQTEWNGIWRNIINEHPLTKRKALFIDKAFTHRIGNLTTQETKELKEVLLERTVRPENTYVHEWQTGDIVIYDNNSTVHTRDKALSGEVGDRTLWRLTFDLCTT